MTDVHLSMAGEPESLCGKPGWRTNWGDEVNCGTCLELREVCRELQMDNAPSLARKRVEEARKRLAAFEEGR